ncbi:hypothetical protein K502DRAFT_346627 [Neoconidiobolus thromboides FSU 785]|nr:hypothetical protein K502DRAFT_346627 [Neoconidiobolus thromboides FSU 785]
MSTPKFESIDNAPDAFIDTTAEVQTFCQNDLSIKEKKFDWGNFEKRVKERGDSKLSISELNMQKDTAINDISGTEMTKLKDSFNKQGLSTDITPVTMRKSVSPLPKPKAGNTNSRNKSSNERTKNHNSKKKKDSNVNVKGKENTVVTPLEVPIITSATTTTITKPNKDKIRRSGSKNKKRNKDKDKDKDKESTKSNIEKKTIDEELAQNLNKLKIHPTNLVMPQSKNKKSSNGTEDTEHQSNGVVQTNTNDNNNNNSKSNTPIAASPNNNYDTNGNQAMAYSPVQFMPIQPNMYPLFMPAQMQDGRFVFVPVTYPMINTFQPNGIYNYNGSPNGSPNYANDQGQGNSPNNAENIHYNPYNAFIANPIYIQNNDHNHAQYHQYYDHTNDHENQNGQRNLNISPQPIFASHVGMGFPGYNGALPVLNNKGEFVHNNYNSNYNTTLHNGAPTKPNTHNSYQPFPNQAGNTNYKTSLSYPHLSYPTNNEYNSHHFLEQNSSTHSTSPIPSELSAEFLEVVNEEAEKICEELNPKEYEKERQEFLLALLRKYLQEVFPDAELHPFGSTANGLGLVNADMDLCVCFTKELDKKVTAVEFVESFGARLKKDPSFDDIKLLTRTRIPIIKLKHSNGLASDIGFENKLALWNTRLLKTYSEIDPRLKKLVYLVKHWSKQRNINEPYLGTLSSYCYVLMTIFYLQQRNPPVLPCLQKISNNVNAPLPTINVDGHNVYFYDDLKNLKKHWTQKNTESVVELLFGFYQYYAYSFHWSRSVVSVRTGIVLTKDEKGWIKAKYSASPSTGASVTDRFWLCVEDPFELEHNLGRPADRNSVYEIRGEFIRATKNLKVKEGKAVLSRLFQTYVPAMETNGANPAYPNPYMPRVNQQISRRSL